MRFRRCLAWLRAALGGVCWLGQGPAGGGRGCASAAQGGAASWWRVPPAAKIQGCIVCSPRLVAMAMAAKRDHRHRTPAAAAAAPPHSPHTPAATTTSAVVEQVLRLSRSLGG